jgi:F-type H+-transporting ATPase subunit delta
MSGSRASIRYAKAVLQQANEAKEAEVVFNDMQTVHDTIQSSTELQGVLGSPVINSTDKKNALLAIFDKQSKTTKSLINVLVENQRTSLLGGVAKKLYRFV